MSDWYAPNQQAVGTDPAAATVEPTKAEPVKATKKSAAKTEEAPAE